MNNPLGSARYRVFDSKKASKTEKTPMEALFFCQ
jgi:hypothetical protein